VTRDGGFEARSDDTDAREKDAKCVRRRCSTRSLLRKAREAPSVSLPSTYSTWWIRQAIQRGIANTSRTIRLPVHAGTQLLQVRQARARLESQLLRTPTRAEIAAELEVSQQALDELMHRSTTPLSLCEPLSDDGDADLADVVPGADRRVPGRCCSRCAVTRGGRRVPGPAHGPGAQGPHVALRPRRRRAAPPRRGGRALRPLWRKDPSDRGQSDGEAASPCVQRRHA
jgi:hypothetical protein